MSVANVLDDVRQIVQSTIKISAERLDIDNEFADLGIDSIIAMELMENLSRHFGINFTPAQFLNVNTVRELANFIAENFSLASQAAAPAAAAQSAPAPAAVVAAPAVTAAPVPDSQLANLLAKAQSDYALDLAGKDLANVDQIVDAIINSNLEQALQRFASGLQAPKGNLALSDVAIVGLSCRLPDAPTPQLFWQNLLAKKSSIAEIPASRWDSAAAYSASPAAGKSISKWAALIEDIACFDAQFFNIRPEEARLIDPQERLLLQETYKALQDAALDVKQLAGSNTGVFIGFEYAEYEHYLRQNITQIPGLVCTSSSPAYYLANRLSFVFDFHGPSEAMNINCASSAVAINRAYLSLISGESDLAIAGAACLHLSSADYVTSSQYGLLSANGSCAVFDNHANGFTRGEGGAVIVLKRLSDAVADQDRIYCVIKASHQSNRGNGNTLSDVKHEAITEVIQRCYQKAGLGLDKLNYIELNGYAKKWADSFEFEGIKNAFAGVPVAGKHCALGSLKGNIGHLEPVNGIASVIKIALAMQHKKFPATITRSTPSSFIDLDSASHPLYFADQEIDFASIRLDAATPIRAGVSSFADSGVNVHIALEEYLPAQVASPVAVQGPQLFVLSAKEASRLTEMVADYLAYLAQAEGQAGLLNQSYTLQIGREAMNVRLAVSASSVAELQQKLQLFQQQSLAGRSKLEAQGVFYGDISAEKNSLGSLITPEMIAKQLDISLQQRQWQQIAMLWVHGVEIPWHRIWAGQTPARVALPCYPFAKVRHWVDVAEVASVGLAPQHSAPAVVAVATPSSVDASASASYQFRLEATAGASAIAMDDAQKIEAFLSQEIALLQACSAQEIDLDSNFLALGMSSIGIAELISKTNTLLQIQLAPTVVFKYPHVRGLAQFLLQSYPAQVANLQVYPAQTASGDAASAVVIAKPVATNNPADLIIPLQTQGTERAIFLVPGADGSVLSLTRLCEALGTQQPLFGIDAQGLDGSSALPLDVTAIARTNLAAMRSVQAHGPYRLFGYSNGGLVAFEMARLLLEDNEEVESLMLLDSLLPALRLGSEAALVAQVFSHQIGNLGGHFAVDVAQLEQVDKSARGQYLYQLLQEHGIEVARDYFLATYRVSMHSEELSRLHQLSPLPQAIAVTLFRGKQSYPNVVQDYGWNHYLQQELEVVEVDANHFTIIEEPAVHKLAEWIHQANSVGMVEKSAVAQARNGAIELGNKKSKLGAREKKRAGSTGIAP